jgi:hypothetical protein
MAYIFDPIRNTFVDDEDTSLGNKLALNDTSEEIIRQIDEQFGPGTVFPASELPPKENPYKDFEDRNPAANGGLMRQNFKVGSPQSMILQYGAKKALLPALEAMGVTLSAARLAEIATENPTVLNKIAAYISAIPGRLEDADKDTKNKLKEYISEFGINIPGVIAPDADEMKREAEKIRELTKPVGSPAETEKMSIKTGETTPPKIDTKESFPAELEKLPFREEFPIEDKQLPIIFENRKQEPPKKRGQKKVEELNPDTVTEIKNIITDYRTQKTNPGKTQPTMTMGDKTELVNLVLDKFQEKEKRLPIYSEVVGLMPQISNLNEVIKYGQIDLPKGKANFDRTDPQYIELMNNKFQTKAIEQNTITNFKDKSFFPETVTLKNGNVVNAKDFFEKNLAERINYGPGRKGNPALQNKELAKLFNTNVRKIEETVKKIKNNPNFKADYPPKREPNYGNQQATLRLKEARKYLSESELANIKIQEKNLNNLNTKFKKGELIVTDYPNLVKALNTTLDKETGILDHSIKKTKKEMIERSKDNSGLFDISHTIPKTSGQKNIEFLKNRNILDYKTNQGLFKSMESYVKNKMDDPDYDLRLEEFDNYMKEMNQLVKIGNRFFGKEQAMINSETGELLGINSQLEYFGLPKFENGVPLKKVKKVKKADGGPIKLSPMPRVDFNGGGAVGADDDFAKELEYFLLNPEAELPKADSYRETMNPVALLNDMIDPRNYAYYADRLAETGIRVGEFGARILPALGQLTADLIQRPAFKVTGGTGQGYVQDYTDIMPSNIKGTGIFTEFLDNLVGTEGTKVITEKTGLKSLIESEEQKQKDRRSTIGPKVLADQVTLGVELTAPIFPGLKLLKAYAKNRKLPVNDTTKEILNKEIDEVLSAQNLTRRDFLKATGAGGTIILAKMLGFGDELATTTKVAEKVAKDTVGGTYPPPYFFKLVEKIRFMGDDITEKAATQDRQVVKKYKDYEMSEDAATGEITILKRNEGSFYDQDGILSEEYIVYKPGIADETTKGTPPPEYEEFTLRPDGEGKLKDSEDGLDSIEEILEEVGDPDSLTLKK